jgi:hypothetical protein
MGSCQSKATFIYDGRSFDFIGPYYASLTKKKEATMLLFIIMLLGSIFDQLLLITNLVTYQNQFFDTLVPVWIVAMWGLFATTLNLSLSWLKSNRVLAVLFGVKIAQPSASAYIEN